MNYTKVHRYYNRNQFSYQCFVKRHVYSSAWTYLVSVHISVVLIRWRNITEPQLNVIIVFIGPNSNPALHGASVPICLHAVESNPSGRWVWPSSRERSQRCYGVQFGSSWVQPIPPDIHILELEAAKYTPLVEMRRNSTSVSNGMCAVTIMCYFWIIMQRSTAHNLQ